ncbi:MAG: DNA topoisomerase 3 [Paludibacteraceae bacterium]|nr:DNA topoisomerase 3 [Paludibacteraceae bacterium]
MIVCIAEKPSVAQEIAMVLGARQRKDGYFEGNGYQVTWTFGHLCTLKEPNDYAQEWKQWRIETLPMIPPRFGIKLISNKGVEHQFQTIEKLFKAADSIVNCGDAGQEGELIQRWVMQKAGVTCPVSRLWISSLTEDAIREGFSNLRPSADFKNLYEAGLCRAIGDWLLGMNATRLYTLRFAQQRQILSIGRVQTPTLAIIVNRQKEIENFKPEQYWELKTTYRDTVFAAVSGKYTSKEKADEALLKIQGKDFVITGVEIKKGTEASPRLYDLTSLQVDCNKKYGFSADETLKLIQTLYEKKLTTYPRVDTTFLSDDIYPKVPGIMKGLTAYSALTDPLSGKKLPKSKKVFDNSKVTDHHAIIPTGVVANNMTDAESKVYDLVARRFISVFYPDCKYSTTTVKGESEGVGFKTSGKEILEEGWRVVYAADKKNAAPADGEQVLPHFEEGERGEHTPDVAEKWTTPPKPYTEATLLRAMETAGKFVDNDELRDAMKENGIGRPSTRAAIIETLFKRNYIKKERKALFATATGVQLIDTIQDELLKSPELTGLWEKKLREIEKGEYDSATFINELKQMTMQVVKNGCSVAYRRIESEPTIVDELKAASAKRKQRAKTQKKPAAEKKAEPKVTDEMIGKPCPKCGKGVVIKGRTAYGCSEWKSGCDWRALF